jgi:hypothetical protein
MKYNLIQEVVELAEEKDKSTHLIQVIPSLKYVHSCGLLLSQVISHTRQGEVVI